MVTTFKHQPINVMLFRRFTLNKDYKTDIQIESFSIIDYKRLPKDH